MALEVEEWPLLLDFQPDEAAPQGRPGLNSASNQAFRPFHFARPVISVSIEGDFRIACLQVDRLSYNEAWMRAATVP